jgi:uncharacterized protein (DUF433 family)
MKKIDSGMYPHLEFNKSIHLNKRPVVKGTRITVEDILDSIASGWDVKRIAKEYLIPEQAVTEALKFASNVLNEVRVFA